ncbi:MAG: hypothetical protein FD171_1369 [Actinobacteria bacterium]|nr:MAG: hypothetical protein FD171_1369 [Actinomycetota bacterium]
MISLWKRQLGGFMKSFYAGETKGLPVSALGASDRAASYTDESGTPPARTSFARIAVYDALTAAPRVEEVSGHDARSFIEALASRTYQLSHEAGGALPYVVIREVVENLIHARFHEVVVTILDSGATVRFADQGPGIADKDRVFLPGFSTATEEMKCVIKGVGSGLPVARECLTFSGGTIVVEDNLGRGTVVTIKVDPAPAPEPENATTTTAGLQGGQRLTTRQKQVLSLVIELGAVGPTVVSRELGVGLSTAYRDLASLEDCGLIHSDETGKRVLTPAGVSSLDQLFNS